MEERYWELREVVDRAWDVYCGDKTEENRVAYLLAIDTYNAFCAEVLEKLMDENSDVLKRLKDA